MKDRDNDSHPELWEQTRSGAWSGRGFHFQHLFSTLILVHQWAGLAPTGNLVPEGQEDCVVELPDRNIWLQIKSRKSGAFSNRELEKISTVIRQKADRTSNQEPVQVAVGLEQPCTGVPEQEIDRLFKGEDGVIVVCKEPEREIVSLLSQKLSVADEVAEILARNLCWLVAESAAENASRTFENRRRISTTEIEQRIHRFLEVSDPSAITHAFDSGALASVDFVTPVPEPGFYQGIKVRPGHLAAGLVLERPTESQAIVEELKNQRHLLITGPSGAGKSALMWLSAHSLNNEMRWYRVSDLADVNHAASIVRSIRACRPSEFTPIGLAFDEVGPSNIAVWNILANELRELPHVYLLGTARNEDVPLIAHQPDTSFFEVRLSQELARSVWQELFNREQTDLQYWQEPYEQSKGLMLEYVHILTQGKRLAEVIGEQVRQRQQADRCDELAIIRGTSVLCALGGEVDAKRLFELLELPPDRASTALIRLLNEHLVRETRRGVLGGLHALRSAALSEASHDGVAILHADTFWHLLLAATHETLPRIIHSVFRTTQPEDETEVVQKLADLLAQNDDVEVWSAIVTGLGLGTIERRVASFENFLEKHGVPRGLWAAAFLFAILDGEMPENTMPEVREAVLAFKNANHGDLRVNCLTSLPNKTKWPRCTDLQQANRFLSCFVPLVGGESVPMKHFPYLTVEEDLDIKSVATFLSTAYEVDPDWARNQAKAFGGEQALLSQYHSKTPWMKAPVIEHNQEHGRTVRADLLHVDEAHQTDPHETIVAICETLLALSPFSDAAASDVIDPSGQAMAVGGFRPWSKIIPRGNLPTQTRISWNVAFRQILQAHATTVNLTDYALTLAQLIRRTEKAFTTFTESWLRGMHFSDTLDTEISQIIIETLRLAHPAQGPVAFSTTTPVQGTENEKDLGALLANLLDNIVPRMKKIPVSSDAIDTDAKTVASFADSRSLKISEQTESDIWRVISSPPRGRLMTLARRLEDTACILHEIGYCAGTAATQDEVGILDSLSGKSFRAAAQFCRQSAKRRLSRRLHILEKELRAKCWTPTIWTRPTDRSKSAYWPAVEIAILVEIEGFDKDGSFLNDCLSKGQEYLGDDWCFSVAPVINGHLLPTFAFTPSSRGPRIDFDYESKWGEHIDLPFLTAELAPNSDAFEKAVGSCHQISAIILSRDMENLFPEEDFVLTKAVERYNHNRKIIEAFAAESGLEEFIGAVGYLGEVGTRVLNECQAAQSGQTIEDPLCMDPFRAIAGEENEETAKLGFLRMFLQQTECKRLAT